MIQGTSRHVVLFCTALVLCAGCTNTRRAPVVEGSAANSAVQAPKPRPAAPRVEPETVPNVYRVKPGDTLYSIAWRFNIDHRQLMSWNRIANPDRILVGQALTLVPPAGPKSGSARPTPAPAIPTTAPVDSPPRTDSDSGERASARPIASNTASKPVAPIAAQAPPQAAPGDELNWRWPAEGAVSRSVSASGAEGLDIRGQRGAPVVAAASGKVVYSGSGLRGYGQLIIIKHNDTFLSAYAHNDQLLVDEGASVQAGQKIASMGDSEAREVMLHFEIRRNGKAVEPSQYLPKR